MFRASSHCKPSPLVSAKRKPAAPEPSQVLTGLVARWKLDDAAGLTALDSVAGNNGSLVGGPTWADDGLIFDGVNDYVNCGDIDSLDFGSGDFSVAFWFNPTSVSVMQVILGKDANASNGRQFFVAIKNAGVNGALSLACFETSTTTRIASTGGGVLGSGVWQHAVLQRTGADTYEIFINGVAQAVTLTGLTIGAMESTPSEFNIGRRSYSGFNNFYGGKIRDVRIYGRKLTADEVGVLYAL